MLDIKKIKGIIFDYGGTIDSNGLHLTEILWMSYEALQIPVNKKVFLRAYEYGEQFIETNNSILPKHNFWHVLRLKVEAQIQWLVDNEYLPKETDFAKTTTSIADWCYAYVQTAISVSLPIIKKLAEKYPLVLVSNFYGNIEAVLRDYHLALYFKAIIESATAGVSKPDPAIFQLGINQLELSPQEIVVIGVSYVNDIVPAASLGCKTIWLKGTGWNEYTGLETADLVISDFGELKAIFELS